MSSDPVPSSAISDATTGGLSVIVITGGSTGDVLTLQSDGTYAPETPSASGGPPFDLGTVTASTPFGITQTWNSGSVGFVGLFANFTDTASAAASYLIDFQKSGVTRLRTTKHGLTRCTFDTAQISNGLEVVGTNGTTYWTIGSMLTSGDQNVQLDGPNKRVNLGGGYLYVEGGSSFSGLKTYTEVFLSPGALGGGGTYVEINNGTAGTYRDLRLRNLRMVGPTVPASASATGSQGDIAWDADYIYVCTATNTWKRVAIATW